MLTLNQVQHYPLFWPADRTRCPANKRLASSYNVTSIAQGVNGVGDELRRWKVLKYVISSNVEPMTYREPADPAVALWFEMPKGQDVPAGTLMVFPSDHFKTVKENLRAISLTMQRLRLVAEIGVYSLGRAVQGATALPGPEHFDWRAELGIARDAQATPGLIQSRYRALAKDRHPDSGGSPEAFLRLTKAVELGMKEAD